MGPIFAKSFGGPRPKSRAVGIAAMGAVAGLVFVLATSFGVDGARAEGEDTTETTATVEQPSRGNYAVTIQNGAFNTASTNQSGHSNVAGTVQSGTGFTSDIQQTGKYQSESVFQMDSRGLDQSAGSLTQGGPLTSATIRFETQ